MPTDNLETRRHTRMFDFGSWGLQLVHLSPPTRVWRCRADANVLTVWQRHQFQSLYRSGHKSKQMLRWVHFVVVFLSEKSLPFLGILYFCLEMSLTWKNRRIWHEYLIQSWQVLSVSITRPVLRRLFRPWMASRLAWRDLKFSSNGPRMPTDITSVSIGVTTPTAPQTNAVWNVSLNR